MAAARVDMKGGTEKTRGVQDGEEGKEYHSDDGTPDDELEMLMPNLERRFQQFDDEEGVSLDFMEVPPMTDLRDFAKNDKENAVFNRNLERVWKRREGSGRMTTRRPIDFDTLLARSRTRVSPSSDSLYKHITTALKENVNKSRPRSHTGDDFWSFEQQQKISGLARRKLNGTKTPVHGTQQPVEDRDARHARSRRGGGNARKLGKRSIKLDLYLDAAKISEWDKEILAVEEEGSCILASSHGFITTGGPFLEADVSAVDEERDIASQSYVNMQVCGLVEVQEEEILPQEGSNQSQTNQASQKANSPSSLLDMELSPGESLPCKDQDVLHIEERCQYPMLDEGASRIEHTLHTPFSEGHNFPDSASMEAMGQNIAGSPGWRSDSQGSHGDVAQQTVNGGPLLSGRNTPVISPTPPSNPVAAYMSLRLLKGEIGQLGQRKLAFQSSSSSETVKAGSSRKGGKTDFGDLESWSDLYSYGTYQVPTPKEVEVDKLQCSESIQSIVVWNGVTLHNGYEVNNERTDKQLLVEEPKSVEDPCCAVQINSSKLREIQLSTCKSAIPNQGENGSVAVSEESLEEDINLEVARKDGAELLHGKSGGPKQPEATVPNTPSMDLSNEMNIDAGTGREGLLLTEKVLDAPENEVGPQSKNAVQKLASGEGLISNGEYSTATEEHHDDAGCEVGLQSEGAKQNLASDESPIHQEGSTAKPRPKRAKRKMKSEERRNSLEESGSIWKDGQRRSQRKRERPLEWWRGEKLLYGRVHKSLSTIIGIKHSSPGKYLRGLSGPLRVESYLPAEYDELVRLAAI